MGYISEETAKGKSFGSLRGTSLCTSVGNTCTDRETSEAATCRKTCKMKREKGKKDSVNILI